MARGRLRRPAQPELPSLSTVEVDIHYNFADDKKISLLSRPSFPSRQFRTDSSLHRDPHKKCMPQAGGRMLQTPGSSTSQELQAPNEIHEMPRFFPLASKTRRAINCCSHQSLPPRIADNKISGEMNKELHAEVAKGDNSQAHSWSLFRPFAFTVRKIPSTAATYKMKAKNRAQLSNTSATLSLAPAASLNARLVNHSRASLRIQTFHSSVPIH